MDFPIRMRLFPETTVDVDLTGRSNAADLSSDPFPDAGSGTLVAPASRFRVPVSEGSGAFALTLDITFARGPHRLTVAINGAPAREQIVSNPGRVTFYHAGDASYPDWTIDVSSSTQEAELRIRQLRIMRLSDDQRERVLLNPIEPQHLESFTGLSAKQLASAFENLGQNCEFGLVQRHCGAEPMGLLRFAFLPYESLLSGLGTFFDKLGSADTLTAHLSAPPEPEYIIRDTGYGLEYHSFIKPDQVDEEKIKFQESRKLKLYVRKFREDVAEGEKIFVYQRVQGTSLDDVLSIFVALNQSTRNSLLWVTASPEHPPGTVEVVFPGLVRGYIDRLAPLNDAHNLNLHPWLSICANAYRLLKRPESSH